MNYPKLPGMIPDPITQKANHSMISHKHLQSKENPKNQAIPLHALPRKGAPDLPAPKDPKSMSYSQMKFQNPYGSEITEQFEPVTVKLDKQVLRFYAYFKEGVVESSMENDRVRVFTICFYLEDNSLDISERKDMNSGIMQGKFLKRHMVRKAGEEGETITMVDFEIGSSISIYGHCFNLIGCDKYTREFYANLGQDQPEDMSIPKDNFAKAKEPVTVKKDTEMIQFLEKSLGGGKVKSEKQFLDKDRKVLEFYATWDNIHFLIHYFLADDTIAIREVHQPNSGRDPTPCMLRRSPLPKEEKGLAQPGLTPQCVEYVTEEDFDYMGQICAYGKWFTLYGCDQFTSLYLKQQFGKTYPPNPIHKPPPPEKKEIILPPYNGYGEEEDSRGYVYNLNPKPPKKDFLKYVDQQKDILRFKARLDTQVPEDMLRNFLILYYLNNDTIMIYEPQQRNSGIQSGKFLQRDRYKKVGQDEFLRPNDFAIGDVIVINSFKFMLLELDEFTKKYLDGHLDD